ncbi:phage integrase central domain-containing protein [Brevundimonas sp.]|uniref:tyrosine-type recombinase/integrase n=1 Tax=Brevundimonas sp. TaxID=1871086 RepID=UPI00289E863A|nr:integrase arm-type DNA-binding domain-containing protein [Brevundimonas sp.]
MKIRSFSCRAINKLSARRVATLNTPGRHSDGNNLYLVIDPSGARRWAFIYRAKRSGVPGAGKLREMGLGSIKGVDLKRARELAVEAHALLAAGVDPISARQSRRAIPTFGEAADSWMADKAGELRSPKSLERWKRALTVHAAALRDIRVDGVTTEDVLAVLKPIWSVKAETAKMARGYIEQVLNAAKAQGWRTGENPARWAGHMDQLLPKVSRLQRGHHKAMAFEAIPGLISNLRERDATAARALEFLILTAGRSGEVREAVWSEIDLAAETWTIPAERMKAGRIHRVPLSNAAVAILEAMLAQKNGDYSFIFPGQKANRPLSNMAFKKLMERLDIEDVTTHGFRSAFRDWAGDRSEHAPELAEHALAHSVGNQVAQAYRRRDALERRRAMMEDWAKHCGRGHASNDQPPEALEPSAM